MRENHTKLNQPPNIDIDSFTDSEIEQMQRTVINTVSILHRKELELNKRGIYVNNLD